jgi:very-short-patch-repair endonuclease
MKSRQPQFYGATKRIFANAKALRKKSTAAEDLMWQMLRNRKVAGYKFRRQHPLKYFVADFYCHEALLVIEVDGSIHELEHIKQYDQNREQEITDLGITFLRFTNDSVFTEPDTVISAIEHFLKHV